jgi:transposase InsO family protein
MEQMGRNVTMQKWGFLANSRYLLHDRDSKFCLSFRQLIEAGKVKTMPLPARSPNLNAYAERWVRSVKQECLSKLILFGERPLRRALQQYVAHYHEERNHQGRNPSVRNLPSWASVRIDKAETGEKNGAEVHLFGVTLHSR